MTTEISSPSKALDQCNKEQVGAVKKFEGGKQSRPPNPQV